MADKVKWEDADAIWNDFNRLWEDAFLEVVFETVETTVGDDLQSAIGDLVPDKKKKFIKLVCKMNNIKIYEESKASIEAKMDVKSVKLALAEISKPKLEIINAI